MDIVKLVSELIEERLSSYTLDGFEKEMLADNMEEIARKYAWKEKENLLFSLLNKLRNMDQRASEVIKQELVNIKQEQKLYR